MLSIARFRAISRPSSEAPKFYHRGESLAAFSFRNGVVDEIDRLPTISEKSWAIGGLPRKPVSNHNLGARSPFVARFPDRLPTVAAPKFSEIRRPEGHFARHCVCRFLYLARWRILRANSELREIQVARRASWDSGIFLISRKHAA